mmetsp:Transcript_9539/g.39037  ORF Transcript_9539/g.39037 Transcript_9539/m.39037 type:complete len:245 (+) Transcript_9539:1007-1741(+)
MQLQQLALQLLHCIVSLLNLSHRVEDLASTLLHHSLLENRLRFSSLDEMVERLLVRLLPGDGEVPVLHDLPILRLQPRAKILELRHLLLEFHLQRRRDCRPGSFLARARARAGALRRLLVGPVQVLQSKLALARGGGYLLDHAVHLVPVPLHRLRPRRRLGLVVQLVELHEFLPDVAEDGLDGGDVGEERLHGRVPAAGSRSRGRRLLVSGRWRGGLFEGVTARLRTRPRGTRCGRRRAGALDG